MLRGSFLAPCCTAHFLRRAVLRNAVPWRAQGHITALTWADTDDPTIGGMFVSGGQDGVVRVWDPRALGPAKNPQVGTEGCPAAPCCAVPCQVTPRRAALRRAVPCRSAPCCAVHTYPVALYACVYTLEIMGTAYTVCTLEIMRTAYKCIHAYCQHRSLTHVPSCPSPHALGPGHAT